MKKRRRRRRRPPLTHGPDAERWRAEYAASLREGVAPPPDMRPVPGGGTPQRNLMSRLHLENQRTRDEILRKAKMVAPAFNKGGLQYLTGKD